MDTVEVGGVNPSPASRCGRCFELRSANFTVTAGEDGITFTVTGYGHGVGMSQYGANALAKQGKSWEGDLKWYYTGVENRPL